MPEGAATLEVVADGGGSRRGALSLNLALALAGTAVAAVGVAVWLRRRRHASAQDGAAKVTELWIYPIKSAGGCSVEAAEVTRFGLRWDRTFAVVAKGEIQTQRQLPQLATIRTRITENALVLSAPGVAGELTVPLSRGGLEPFVAKKLGSVALDLHCFRYGAEVSEWLNSALKVSGLLLVQLDVERATADAEKGGERGPRLLRSQLAGEVAGQEDSCAIHDWSPFLLASKSSLQDLNGRLRKARGKAVDMDRFRPNVVLSGDLDPYEEDKWTVVRIGTLTFRCVQGCVRCIVPTIDQRSGERPDGANPTKELEKFRKMEEASFGPYAPKGPVFGTWAVPSMGGIGQTLRVGDELAVGEIADVSSYDYWSKTMARIRAPAPLPKQ